MLSALGVYRGDLVVGGRFTVAGGKVSPFFARWGPVGGEVDPPDSVEFDTNRTDGHALQDRQFHPRE